MPQFVESHSDRVSFPQYVNGHVCVVPLCGTDGVDFPPSRGAKIELLRVSSLARLIVSRDLEVNCICFFNPVKLGVINRDSSSWQVFCAFVVNISSTAWPSTPSSRGHLPDH